MNYNQRDALTTMVYQEGMDAIEAIIHLLPAATVSISTQYDKTEEHSVYASKLKEAKQLLMDAYITERRSKSLRKQLLEGMK